MTRAELHALVDTLPEAAVNVAGTLLQRAAHDPEAAALLATPWDDEPYTPEQRAADQASIAALAAGMGTPWDQLQAEFDAV